MKHQIFSDWLIVCERIGCKMPIIEIYNNEKRKTIIHLKIWFVSMGLKSKDAREFYKKNFKVVDQNGDGIYNKTLRNEPLKYNKLTKEAYNNWLKSLI